MNDIVQTSAGPTAAPISYSRKDFESDQTVRWCPGCGDYSILAQVQRVMPRICAEMNLRRDQIVFVSGIGCSSRFPYYMNTYGFHTIHGRAPTVATGLAVSRPDLQVWVITGDGDGLSIGGNHFLHCLRRNVDLKILLFNNRIYGLTKGQYSPTSERGKRTKSSPMGTFEEPINPLYTALTAGATFAARAIATDAPHLQEMLLRAARHRGTAFIEIFQNCNVFNDEAFDHFSDRSVRDERVIYLKHGQPILFGKNRDKTIIINSGASGLKPLVVDVADVPAERQIVFREDADPNFFGRFLALMDEHAYPMSLGVYQAHDKPIYDDQLDAQIAQAMSLQGRGDFFSYLHQGDTWEVR
ncbi:MAG: 2-oxoacid:ferredoxin oxidoreductase subunit beta [Gammaproteobacteria bacterium]|nr:2-oxoacid:ferredoxin oxidoreductase subunit beta [Gammaproteobacteria bacterium]